MFFDTKNYLKNNHYYISKHLKIDLLDSWLDGVNITLNTINNVHDFKIICFYYIYIYIYIIFICMLVLLLFSYRRMLLRVDLQNQ